MLNSLSQPSPFLSAPPPRARMGVLPAVLRVRAVREPECVPAADGEQEGSGRKEAEKLPVMKICKFPPKYNLNRNAKRIWSYYTL